MDIYLLFNLQCIGYLQSGVWLGTLYGQSHICIQCSLEWRLIQCKWDYPTFVCISIPIVHCIVPKFFFLFKRKKRNGEKTLCSWLYLRILLLPKKKELLNKNTICYKLFGELNLFLWTVLIYDFQGNLDPKRHDWWKLMWWIWIWLMYSAGQLN